jgi:hypothetical protein
MFKNSQGIRQIREAEKLRYMTGIKYIQQMDM